MTPLMNPTHSVSQSPRLLSPYDLKGLLLKNRVVMAPLTRGRAGAQRVPNDLMLTYYTQRASAGMIVSEATVISEQGIGWVDSPGIYNAAQVEGWRKIASGLREEGTPFFLQMWHCGRASHSSFHGGAPAVSASAIKIGSGMIHTPVGKVPHEVPRALGTAEVADVVEDYRRAAMRAKDAGFDGVEIHAANGYLINQFLDSKTNHRTDQYGGSVENRYRFLEEIVEAVLTVWPVSRVAVRLSPNGNFNDMGSPDFRETYSHVAAQLNAYGLAYLHVVDGLSFGFHEQGKAMTLGEFRSVYSGPLMGNCGYTEASAEEAIASVNADLVAFGRPFLSNPDLVERFENGWELNPPAALKDWSAPTAEGYTDFPFHAKE